MSDPESRQWTEFVGGRRESRPYRACPRCDRFKYRTIETVPIPFLGGESWDECENCGYAPNHPNDR